MKHGVEQAPGLNEPSMIPRKEVREGEEVGLLGLTWIVQTRILIVRVVVSSLYYRQNEHQSWKLYFFSVCARLCT